MPRHFDRVLYLSLNYDTLLDQALSILYAHRFTEFRRYLMPSWALVKLHGSVDWGYAISPVPNGDGHDGYITALNELEQDPPADERFLVILRDHRDRVRDHTLFYPAMAVPVEQKSGFVCPAAHADYARHFMRRCASFLIIGCQLLDQDVRDLFTVVERVDRFMIVNGTPLAGEAVFQRLRETGTAFNAGVRSVDDHVYPDGFSQFVTTDRLTRFLEGR
jgi:hypothetical protein